MLKALTVLALLIPGIAEAASPSYSEKEVTCLTRNIYEEARGESIKAQITVGLIVRQRVFDYRWPKTYCEVVYQKNQFSWTKDRTLREKQPVDTVAWAIANYIAHGIIAGKYRLTGGMECARWYKREDDKGVSKNSKRFFATLASIGAFDSHRAYGYQDCVHETSL
jgi:hypothetical protein